MKRKIVLLIDADADTTSLAVEAATLAELDVRFARTSRDLFQMIEAGLDDVAVIVLDVDPGVHGMAVLEALDAWQSAPPVVVLSSLEESYVRPVAFKHGAVECLGKPVSIQQLKTAIEEFSRTTAPRSSRCDRWGHSCEDCDQFRARTGANEYAFFAEKY